LIVYLPFIQAPFGTIGLSPADWTFALGIAFTITPILELAKWMVRRGFFGKQE
jgi:Ca2+-transporting ATPase